MIKFFKVNFSFVVCLILSGGVLFAQDQNNVVDTNEHKRFLIINTDSILTDKVELEEVFIFPKINFENRDDFRSYLILKRKTKKVWPYAALASERFETLNHRLEQIETKRGKREYTKIIQKYVEDEFTEELKKLTRTEGQILVKLVHRQTGITIFDLVKDLRSGWRAFWYNTTANFFDISLKEEFQPYTVKEDFYIEDILQREFQSGALNKQAPKIDIEFLELLNKWQTTSKSRPPSVGRGIMKY